MAETKIVTLVDVLADRYDVGPVVAPTYCVLWAAEFLADNFGIEHAKAELKKVNAIRTKHGAISVSAPYGHKLF